jgi:hypothetical protein
LLKVPARRPRMMSWKWLGFQVWVMGPQQPVGPTGVLQVWADQLVNPH